MSAVMKMSEERLMKVLLAPVVSEKATFIAEKYEQVIFRVLKNATKPEIKAAVENQTKVTVSGAGKEQVGQVAAEIRSIRAPEPYKGKGIRYADEVVRRKVGKSGGKGKK